MASSGSLQCSPNQAIIFFPSWNSGLYLLKLNNKDTAYPTSEIMRKYRLLPGILIATVLLFSSCTGEEESLSSQSNQAMLSFNALFNDQTFRQNSKQSAEVPACSSGLPVFVDVILSRNGVFVAGTEDEPLRLALDPNATDLDNDGTLDYFTGESASLKLSPGTYTLEYFTVLDANGNLIWIAPNDDGTKGGFNELLENSLPLEIRLGAGVKKYVDVGVVCFDNRIVNQYGYLFFDLNGIEVIPFCIFGNYCDEAGRHAEYVRYSVNVWKYSNDPLFPKGELLYEDLVSAVIVTDYEDYAETAAEPLCINLPDGPGFDEYYIEITMIEPGTSNEIIRSGLISDVDVRNLFSGDDELEFYHFREGNCNMEDSPVLLDDHRKLTGFD